MPLAKNSSPEKLISKEKEILSCRLCGSKDAKIWLKDYEALRLTDKLYTVYACVNCGFKFLNPQPTEQEMAVLYGDGFYASTQAQKKTSKGVAALTNLLASERASLIERYAASKGNLLDVGCGAGGFLLSMHKRGWRVMGVDPSPNAKSSAPEVLRTVIQNGHLADVDPSKTFDVMTLWHSLEHVPEPEMTVQEAAKRMSPKGIIVISVPNGNGVGNWFGKRWAFLDIPRHLYHFSPANLRDLLIRNGFSVRKEIHFLFEYSPVIMLLNLIDLLTTRKMYLYYFLKGRNMDHLKMSGAKHAYNLCISVLGAVIFALPAFLLSVLFALAGRGDCYTVVASKEGSKA